MILNFFGARTNVSNLYQIFHSTEILCQLVLDWTLFTPTGCNDLSKKKRICSISFFSHALALSSWVACLSLLFKGWISKHLSWTPLFLYCPNFVVMTKAPNPLCELFSRQKCAMLLTNLQKKNLVFGTWKTWEHALY